MEVEGLSEKMTDYRPQMTDFLCRVEKRDTRDEISSRITSDP